MTSQISSILDRLRSHLPPVLPLADFDQHPALPSAKTIRNMRSLRTVPNEMFVRDGKRVLVDVAAFLVWWGERLQSEGRVLNLTHKGQ